MGCRGDLQGREVVEQAMLPNEFSATVKMSWRGILSSETPEIPRMLG